MSQPCSFGHIYDSFIYLSLHALASKKLSWIYCLIIVAGLAKVKYVFFFPVHVRVLFYFYFDNFIVSLSLIACKVKSLWKAIWVYILKSFLWEEDHQPRKPGWVSLVKEVWEIFVLKLLFRLFPLKKCVQLIFQSFRVGNALGEYFSL